MASSDWTFILVLPLLFQLGEPCRALETGGTDAIGVYGGNNAQILVKQATRAQKTEEGTAVSSTNSLPRGVVRMGMARNDAAANVQGKQSKKKRRRRTS